MLSCGRRWGKSTLGINRLIEPALKGYPVGWFAPTYKLLTEIWREMKMTLEPVISHKGEQEHRLELVTGGIVEMWSLDQDVARGRRYKSVIIDEAAMVPKLEEAWTAAIRPTLTDFSGGAWFFSTPKGRNYFWRLWQRGEDSSETDWASWRMPTSANPHIQPKEIESARRELPERTFAQEYLAEFLEDGGGVFRGVTNCATMPSLPVPSRARQTVMGVDWGKSNDFTVLTVIDTRTKELVGFDRFNKIDWGFQRQRLTSLYDAWNCTSILAEENSIGGPNIDALRREGLPIQGFTTTNSTKAQIIEGLSLAIETRQIAYPNIPELVSELQAYEMERLPSGLMRYGAPEGMHDDCVMSLAIAWHAVSDTGGRSRMRRMA